MPNHAKRSSHLGRSVGRPQAGREGGRKGREEGKGTSDGTPQFRNQLEAHQSQKGVVMSYVNSDDNACPEVQLEQPHASARKQDPLQVPQFDAEAYPEVLRRRFDLDAKRHAFAGTPARLLRVAVPSRHRPRHRTEHLRGVVGVRGMSE